MKMREKPVIAFAKVARDWPPTTHLHLPLDKLGRKHQFSVSTTFIDHFRFLIIDFEQLTVKYGFVLTDELVDIVRDTFLWRKKRLSLATLLTSTAIWVVIEVYQFSFVALTSYVAMFIVAALFLRGMMHRLLGKESPEMSRLEVSERVVVDFANTVRGWVEESERWMLQIGAEGDWLTFAVVMASLWSMSRIGLHFDLVTLLYLCVVLGLMVSPLSVRYREKIKVLKDAAKARCQGLYGTLNEKVIRKFSGASKTCGLEEKKEEKIE